MTRFLLCVFYKVPDNHQLILENSDFLSYFSNNNNF